jgi:hypothetical protein
MESRTNDSCPQCGEPVKPTGEYGIGSGQPMREPDQETATCPKCRTELIRGPGAPWTKMSERYPDPPQAPETAKP